MLLEELIEQCVARKRGNQEFALFRDNANVWSAEIGNPSPMVRLGETEGEYCATGRTAIEAVRRLFDAIPGERR